MSKKIFIAILLLIFAGAIYYFNFYIKDRVLSFKSSLFDKKSQEIFIDLLKDNDKKAIFCDIKFSKKQNMEFEREHNRSDHIHLKSFNPKRYEYIFISSEDRKSAMIYDKNSSTLKGLFLIDLKINDRNKSYFYLKSITPKELKILNNL